MSAAIAHRGPDGASFWLEGDCGLSFQAMYVTPEAASAAQPFVFRNGVVVMFDGRLDNREELRDLLAGEVPRDAADCEFIAAAYQRFGEESFSRLLGDFAI